MPHPLHRVAGIPIGQGMLGKGVGDLGNGIGDAMAGLKSGGDQLAGILPVGAGVVGFADDDLGADLAFDPLGDIKNRDIFKTGVVAAAGDVRMGQEVAIHIGNVLNVDVGPGLVAAEDGDLAILEGLVAEHVHAHIKPHARREAADGGGPDAMHLHLILIRKKHPLGHHLGFVVHRDRHQGEVFGDVGLIFYPVHTAGAGEDELLHPCPHGPIGELLAGQHIHLPAEGGVEFHRRVVGDVG